MKYLFIFAHPDDETVACGGTIKKLVENGDEVVLVTATEGEAGEVKPEVQPRVQQLGSVGKLRREEMTAVSKLLGVHQLHILDFRDGEVTNKMVWNELTTRFIEVIEQYQPDIVITFDHSGWYFHLDHVGVSIATTLAVQRAKHQPDLFFLTHFRVSQTKWKYVYSKEIPATHYVDVTDKKPLKLQAYDLHASQNLSEPRRQLLEENEHRELFQLASATPRGEKLLEKHPHFKPLKK